jgi:hypothetical protein
MPVQLLEQHAKVREDEQSQGLPLTLQLEVLLRYDREPYKRLSALAYPSYSSALKNTYSRPVAIVSPLVLLIVR